MNLAVMGVVAVSIVAGLYAIQPHTLLEQDGLFVAKDLFTVPSRAGFTAAYPPLAPRRGATTEYVEQGTVLVTFRPSPNPKELAAASLQRDILQEQLTDERTSRPPAEPALQNQLDGLARWLDLLNQRQKELISQRDHYQREEAKAQAAGTKVLVAVGGAVDRLRFLCHTCAVGAATRARVPTGVPSPSRRSSLPGGAPL